MLRTAIDQPSGIGRASASGPAANDPQPSSIAWARMSRPPPDERTSSTGR
jgi:hypothetical protein